MRLLLRCCKSRFYPKGLGHIRCFSDSSGVFCDRDYHVHLGGAIPPQLVRQWIDNQHIGPDDVIPDLVAATEYKHPMIKVSDALIKYRGHTANIPFDEDEFLLAYNTPEYSDLPTFLTMYRAYSKRHLLHEYASTIARGQYMHPYADVRVSLPVPNEYSNARKETPSEYANRAMSEMLHFQRSLLPTQRLFITFPRQTFNKYKNRDYFNAFIHMLSERMADPDADSTSLPMPKNQQLAFDFAGQPLPLTQTIQLLYKLRTTFPGALICYHHGEVTPSIPFGDRIKDSLELIPYVNRIGHGLCLGLAVLNLHSEQNGILNDATAIDQTVLDENKRVALRCLHEMADRNIGIEVSPTCNISLGGASSTDILRRYVTIFLEEGVNVFLGTGDPGFLNTTLEKEKRILQDY